MDATIKKSDDSQVTERIVSLISKLPLDEKLKLLKVLEADYQIGLRVHPRKECFIPADYVTHGRVYRDFIKNISAGGVFIENREALSPGGAISLTFSLPNVEDPIKISGKIVWIASNGIGVRFNSEQQKAVVKILEENIVII